MHSLGKNTPLDCTSDQTATTWLGSHGAQQSNVPCRNLCLRVRLQNMHPGSAWEFWSVLPESDGALQEHVCPPTTLIQHAGAKWYLQYTNLHLGHLPPGSSQLFLAMPKTEHSVPFALHTWPPAASVHVCKAKGTECSVFGALRPLCLAHVAAGSE